MAKKKGKRVDPEKKAALAARKEAKAEKAALKRGAKGAGDTLSADDPNAEASDPDFDRLLEQYKNQDRLANGPGKFVTVDGYPLARANATLTMTTGAKKKEAYLFGGEYFDGAANVVSDQLFKLELSNEKWKQVISLPCPPPRCAHSTVYYNRCLFVFGGEYASGTDFSHYKDVWKFDTAKLQWSEIRSPNGPSSRSGHSAVVWKQFMIIFGGFFEASADTPRWFNDVSVMNLQTEQWLTNIPHSKLSIRPDPRSGCNTALIDDQWLVHGGFCKRLDRRKATTGSAAEEGQKPAPEGHVYSDAWTLQLEPLLDGNPPVWERYLSTASSNSSTTTGTNPNGRSGVGSVVYNKNMLLVGGVVDQELHHHMVKSIFYDDISLLHFEKRKFVPIQTAGEKTAETADSQLQTGWDFDRLQNIGFVKEERNDADGEEQEEDHEETTRRKGKTKLSQKLSEAILRRKEPLPRIKPCLFVDGSTLYLYGGLLEIGDRECTLDDFWCIELRKKRVWECLFAGTMHKQVWKGDSQDDDNSIYSNADSTSQLGGASASEDSDDEEKEQEEDD